MDLFSAFNLLLFIIGFGSLIFVHELGHFLVAKWVGIRATQFAIGFGQAVLCYRRGIGYRVGTTEPEYHKRVEDFVRERRKQAGREDEKAEITTPEIEEAERELGLGETEYRLNWIPFGGYVKMVGQEDLDPKAVSDDPRAYNNKPIWARFAVISAGVVMNAIFAVLFFMIAFMIGVAFPTNIVGDVAPGSPAANAPAADHPDIVGLRPGDRIVAIDGKEATDFMDVRIASALGRPDQPINLNVQRPHLDGSHDDLRFTVTPVEDPDMGLLHVGIMPALDLNLAEQPSFAPLLRAQGIEPGMRLVAVDGRPVEAHWEYQLLFEAADGRPLELTFEQPETRQQEAERRTVTLQPETQFMHEQGRAHLLGLQPATQIRRVEPGSPADDVLQFGDVIVSAGGLRYPTVQQFVAAVREAEDAINLTILRDGETQRIELTPSGGRVGVELGAADAFISAALPDSPYAGLDLPPGTRLLQVDGQPVATLTELRRAIEQADPDQRTFEITFELPVGDVVETAEITLDEDRRAAVAELGWTDNLPFTVLQLPQQTSNPFTAIALGVSKTQSFMVQTYLTINRLFTGTVRVEHLRGPIGIVDEGTRFADRGFGYLLFFLGLISINLAVINFLPLPIVDGGHALLLLWEKIRGKPAPPEVQSALTVIGLLLIGALFLTVTWYDIARIFTGG